MTFIHDYIAMQNRTLARVLLDIDTAAREWDRKQGDEAESQLLDHLDILRAEAREALESATGVTWDQLSQANL